MENQPVPVVTAAAPGGSVATAPSRPDLGPPAFDGEFERDVDAKNRVVIPTEFRPWLVGAAFLLLMPAGFVSLVTPDEHDRVLGLARRSGSMDADLQRPADQRGGSNRAADAAVRALSRRFQLVRPDAQGRFVLPERYLTHAGIGDKVVFVGTQLRVELWAPDRLDGDDDALADSILGDWQAMGPR